MSDQTGASWLSETRNKLRDQSEAIVEALDDLAATLGDQSDRGPATWVDLHPGKSVTVYVLTPGLLHRFSGATGSPADPGKPDEARESACEYRTFPITRGTTFSLSVIVTSAADRSRAVERCWTFRFGEGPDESISVAVPTGEQTIDDPAPFARALATSIASASASGGGG
jgi:hypothetical protein